MRPAKCRCSGDGAEVGTVPGGLAVPWYQGSPQRAAGQAGGSTPCSWPGWQMQAAGSGQQAAGCSSPASRREMLRAQGTRSLVLCSSVRIRARMFDPRAGAGARTHGCLGSASARLCQRLRPPWPGTREVWEWGCQGSIWPRPRRAVPHWLCRVPLPFGPAAARWKCGFCARGRDRALLRALRTGRYGPRDAAAWGEPSPAQGTKQTNVWAAGNGPAQPGGPLGPTVVVGGSGTAPRAQRGRPGGVRLSWREDAPGSLLFLGGSSGQRR